MRSRYSALKRRRRGRSSTSGSGGVVPFAAAGSEVARVSGFIVDMVRSLPVLRGLFTEGTLSHALLAGRDVSLGDDCRAGHHAIIREGSRLGQDVQVGTETDLQCQRSGKTGHPR